MLDCLVILFHTNCKKVALSFSLSSCDQLLEVSEKFIIPPKDYEIFFASSDTTSVLIGCPQGMIFNDD